MGEKERLLPLVVHQCWLVCHITSGLGPLLFPKLRLNGEWNADFLAASHKHHSESSPHGLMIASDNRYHCPICNSS